jgi:PPK2 family polyphosphate:nucleotide phosphotransferase
MAAKSRKRKHHHEPADGRPDADPTAGAPIRAPEVPLDDIPVSARTLPDVFALPGGLVSMGALTTDRLPSGPADKKAAAKRLAAISDRLSELQERLFAASTAGDKRRILLVLQGMDTSGKDGVVKHVMGLMNPSGVWLVSFKKPTTEELTHDFLWRVERRVPPAGSIGVFNRSHYEDVLIARVHNLVEPAVWSRRYAAINAFERRLARNGVTIVKCFLHVSKQEQAERLVARLADPTKYWKFNPGDIDERARWNDYQEAYRVALTRCSTTVAPWYVIPSDHKWYRNWAVAELMLAALERLDPKYPPARFDIGEQQARLAAEMDS